MRASTQTRYADRIAAVVRTIEARPEEPPSARELAGAAAMSPFHFHRVFRAVTGETVQETVRRLRIARAVALLREEGASVTDVAFAVGYESSQAFAKAFRALTGTSATEAKAQGLDALAEKLARPPSERAALLEVNVVSVEPFRVAAVTRTGSTEKLAHGYRALVERAMALGFGDALRGVFGIPADDPFDTPIDDRRHVCCMDFGEHVDRMPDGDITIIGVAGGLYARARHVGRYEDIDDAYVRLYAAVIAQGGFAFAEAPAFTTYVDTPDDAPPDRRRVDLNVPIIPLSETAS